MFGHKRANLKRVKEDMSLLTKYKLNVITSKTIRWLRTTYLHNPLE